jgi:hypothetical protein
MTTSSDRFIRFITHPLRQRLFLFLKLPSAFFSGVRIRHLDAKKCVVSVPYKWFSQNPFRSTYFACLSMAAEMSTGLPALAQVYQRKPSVSMLVISLESTFIKKATSRTYFTCNDGEEFERIIRECITDNTAKTFVSRTTGTNEQGEKIAEFIITWSFKAKSK